MREADSKRSIDLLLAERGMLGGSHSTGTDKSRTIGPKLPHFDQSSDNMDSYLARFERYAVVQGWKREQWSLHLSALLKGKALDVYSRLPADDALAYDKLKTALLKSFDLTEDGFRKKFRNGRPDQGESFTQFVSRSGII